MLVTEKLVYIHIPKTAGHFAKKHIKRFCGNTLYEGEWHGRISSLPSEYTLLPIVSFVRNPWDWYVSWFYHQKDSGFFNPLAGAAAANGAVEFAPAMRFIMKSIRSGTKENRLLLRFMESAQYKSNLSQKIKNEPGLAVLNKNMIGELMRKKIGMLTWRYEYLLGEMASAKCIFGKYENLCEDLIRIFDHIGIQLREEGRKELMLDKPLNRGVSRFNRGYKGFYDQALIKLVENKEAKIINKFGYTFE